MLWMHVMGLQGASGCFVPTQDTSSTKAEHYLLLLALPPTNHPLCQLVLYDVTDVLTPVFLQIIPTARGPESAVALPERNLLIVAGEADGGLTLIAAPENAPAN